jgi:hypothetical protein
MIDEDMRIYLEAKFDGVHGRFDEMKDRVDGHGRTLYGDDGRGGLVSDVGSLKEADLPNRMSKIETYGKFAAGGSAVVIFFYNARDWIGKVLRSMGL